MSNFWIGFIIGGFICGIIGFLSAAILAASSKGSRMEETLVLKSKDVLWFPFRPFDKKDTYGTISKKETIAIFDEKGDVHVDKSKIKIVTQNNPRTD